MPDVMFLQVFSKNVFGNLAGLRDGAPRRSLRWLTSPKLYGLGLCGFERAAIELHRDVDDARQEPAGVGLAAGLVIQRAGAGVAVDQAFAAEVGVFEFLGGFD